MTKDVEKLIAEASQLAESFEKRLGELRKQRYELDIGNLMELARIERAEYQTELDKLKKIGAAVLQSIKDGKPRPEVVAAMAEIEIVASPRPQVDPSPLPDYYDCLDRLCNAFGVPGSQTFNEAITWIKEHWKR